MNFDSNVKFTRDYSRFKKVVGNRDVKSYKRVLESIKNVGYIPNPIIVNENYEVIDGQHRLQACEELGISIAYIMIPGLNIESARSMNIGQKNWKTEDYIKSFSATGNESYTRVLNLWKLDPGHQYAVIVALLKNIITSRGNATQEKCIKAGALHISNVQYEKARETLYKLQDFVEPLKKIPGDTSLKESAFGWILRNTNVSKLRLLNLVQTQYREFYPDTRIDYFLDGISAIYNKGVSKKIYLNTEYETFKDKTRGGNQ